MVSHKMAVTTASANVPDSARFRWDEFAETTMGRYLFRHEHTFITRFVESPRAAGRIIDLGCGSGRLTVELRAAGFAIVGLDINPIALCAFRTRNRDAPLVRGDIATLPFQTASANCLIAIQCVEYLDFDEFFRECSRVLRRHGWLIFDSLNRTSYKYWVKRAVGVATLPSRYRSIHELTSAAVRHRFDVEKVVGYGWVPFSRNSNSALVPPAAQIEKALGLGRWYQVSPRVLVATRKR